MEDNLLVSIKTYFSDELISKAALYLGESQTGIYKAMEGVIPTLLAEFASQSVAATRRIHLLSAAKEQFTSGIFEKIEIYFENGGGGILNKSAKLFTALFGEKADELIALISNFSGITKSSAVTLLSVSSTVILGLLGKEMADKNLDANGLGGLLSSQKNNFVAAMPSGLNFTNNIEAKPATTTHYSNEIKMVTEKTEDNSSNGLKILLPLLLLALTAGAFLYFWRGGNVEKKKTDNTNIETPAIVNNSGAGIEPLTTSTGTVDSNGNFIYSVGDTITLTLPNSSSELKVGKYSTEAKLVTFLQDGNSKIDTVKGNWFEFTNVRFKSGGAVIEEASMDQLKNIVVITKGFPKAQFKIGGYSDSTGNAKTNITLSQKRADAVLDMLLKMGASSKSVIGAKGYGPEHPVASNTTPEGRAQNRRVAINIKAKN